MHAFKAVDGSHGVHAFKAVDGSHGVHAFRVVDGSHGGHGVHFVLFCPLVVLFSPLVLVCYLASPSVNKVIGLYANMLILIAPYVCVVSMHTYGAIN